MAYSTLTELKSTLGVTGNEEDARLTNALNGAIAYTENYCGRNFSGTARTVTDEVHVRGNFDDVDFELFNYDIRAITSVTLDDQVLDSTKYMLVGRTVRFLDWQSFSVAKVSYTYGTPETPVDINIAILVIAKALYSAAKENDPNAGRKQSESVGDVSVTYHKPETTVVNLLGDLPSNYLDAYRMVTI